MTSLANKNILLCICGGIAAYKCAELVREFRRENAHVKVIMTQAAQAFITPLTLQALSGHPVFAEEWLNAPQQAMDHITLARWADIILLAPATADSIARLAHGHANDLLTTTCLAATAPIVVAPAMNQQMWQNSLVQANIARLQQHGMHIIEPASGEQACGEIGPGRLPEPTDLLRALSELFTPPYLTDYTIMITAGPTQEAIDPVRYLSNHSSGKMGYALAQVAAEQGARVILISGPTALSPPAGVCYIPVTTATDMLNATMHHIKKCHVFVGAAAVADYRPLSIAPQKLKKQGASIDITLVQNPDIVAEVAKLSPKPLVVGFAAETENLQNHALKKLHDKQLDLIVANYVGEQKGFCKEQNAALILDKDGVRADLPLMPKFELAKQIMKIVFTKLNNANSDAIN